MTENRALTFLYPVPKKVAGGLRYPGNLRQDGRVVHLMMTGGRFATGSPLQERSHDYGVTG